MQSAHDTWHAETSFAALSSFITGNSPKDAYSIKTPTATIGVRG
jgi:hypothetical protein